MSNGAKEIESECAASVSQVRSLVAGMSKDTQKIETDCTANISQLSSKVSEVTTRLHSLQILQSQLQEEISTLKEKYLLCNFNQGWLHFQNKCYYLSSSTADWRKAKENCIGLQSHLAVVTTQKLQNLLQERTGDEKYWIGLSDIEVEGQWKWVDGTDYNSNEKFWMPGEPNAEDSGEDCAHFWKAGKWNDGPCNRHYKFICEKGMS
ncbi:hepatic lectin-like [Latimeria chalumnae]|uniref:hepatic lectin-like n=1 Tax=Latimeria chalumnae TaxID=7897 RepID=UPI00313A8EFD